MIGFIVTLIGGAIAGWYLKGKMNKKPEYHNEGSHKDPDEDY